MIYAVPPSLQTSFQLLGRAHNLAAVPALEYALRSTVTPVRIAALQALIQRGDRASIEVILRCIDLCDQEELSLLASHSNMLVGAVEAALDSSEIDSVLQRQQALVAIAKLRLTPLISRLVEVAESSNDPQQIVAIQLLKGLAEEMGQVARLALVPRPSPFRDELLRSLNVAACRFVDHRIGALLEAWLSASHWEDPGFLGLFSPFQEPYEALLAKRLKTITKSQVGDLLCGCYWGESATVGALELFADWDDHESVRIFLDFERRFGVTPALIKNLVLAPLPRVFSPDNRNASLNALEHCSLLRVATQANLTPDVVLRVILNAIAKPEHLQDEGVVSTAVRGMRSLGVLEASVVTMVLSDSFSLPDIDPYVPPPWKASFRGAIDEFLDRYHELPQPMQSAFDFMMSEFRCDTMLHISEIWPEAHVEAFGRIVRLVDKETMSQLHLEARSPAAQRRARAVRVAVLLGVPLKERSVATINEGGGNR